jgi:hypothetical protein
MIEKKAACDAGAWLEKGSLGNLAERREAGRGRKFV